MKTSHATLLLLSACMLAPKAARAAYLTIDDTSPNETVTISVGQFEGGFYVNGNFLVGGYDTGSITLPESGPLNFWGRWIDLGASQTQNRTIYLVEPDDPTLISDVLQYSVVSDGWAGTISGQFWSDVGNNLGHLPVGVNPADVFVENGQWVGFSQPYLWAEFRSDVPEQGGFALLPMSLGAIGFCARLLRKPTKA